MISFLFFRLCRVCVPWSVHHGDGGADVRAGAADLLRELLQSLRLHRHPGQRVRGVLDQPGGDGGLIRPLRPPGVATPQNIQSHKVRRERERERALRLSFIPKITLYEYVYIPFVFLLRTYIQTKVKLNFSPFYPFNARALALALAPGNSTRILVYVCKFLKCTRLASPDHKVQLDLLYSYFELRS